MRRFLIALQFLTIFPIKVKSPVEGKELGASLLYFPLVGLLIGITLSLLALLLSSQPTLLRSATILVVSIVVTGAIHLDGFADTCDGFYGSRSKEKMLEIMRDSRIGTMGVVGLISLLLIKFSLIASLGEAILGMTLIAAATFSRWVQVAACFNASYARQEGKAKYFVEYVTKIEFYAGLLFTLGLFYLAFKTNGLILFFASLMPPLLFLQYIKRRIGGVTGDAIGALNEFAEVSVLLFAFFMR